jgi:aspartate/methionine/tyrosine aminotransferase
MDPVDGGGFVRLSFAASMDTVQAAVDRIERFQQRA